MNDFVESFLESLETDKSHNKGTGNWITKILMSAKGNQGTITFVPFLNKKNNNFYLKLSKVKAWKGHTTRFESGVTWYNILPEEYYVGLTEENRSLLEEINGLYDSIEKLDVLTYHTIRDVNYSLFYGYLLSHKNISGKEITDNINKPCLFIFPSHSPINAISTAITAKCQLMKGSKSWITAILSPNNTGRDGVMGISFKYKGPGYDSTVTFEFNGGYNGTLIEPTKVFDEEITKFFNDPIRDLLGWQGEGENGYFNPEIMRELRDDLKLKLKELQAGGNSVSQSQNYVNDNGQQNPTKVVSQTPVTPVNAENAGVDLPF